MRKLTAWLVSCWLVALGAPAAAQDRAAAEAAFREARRLMAAGQFEAACPKLELSERLDPATGTLLNLADCYAKLGRTASAWAAFVDVQQRERKTARAREAGRRAAALEPRLMRLRIEIADPPADLEVTRDGQPAAALVGDAVPVDPGRHAIVATAAGARFATEVSAEREGETYRVTIPPFWRAVAEPAPAPPAAPPSAAPRERQPRSSRRTVALVAGAVGLAAVAAGLAFGLKARSSWNDSRAGCDAQNFCDDAAYDKVSSAQRAATISTVLVAAGAGAVVTGGVLWLTAPSRERRIAVVPAVAPGLWGLAVRGSL